MKIEILGTGCVKCRRLEENVRKAVKEAGVQAEIVKIEDLDEIIGKGIMMTPALIIDGEERAIGRVLGVEEIKRMIRSG
ncbi:MAG: thioredoxin family protein [Thermoplasmatota archaeon]